MGGTADISTKLQPMFDIEHIAVGDAPINQQEHLPGIQLFNIDISGYDQNVLYRLKRLPAHNNICRKRIIWKNNSPLYYPRGNIIVGKGEFHSFAIFDYECNKFAMNFSCGSFADISKRYRYNEWLIWFERHYSKGGDQPRALLLAHLSANRVCTSLCCLGLLLGNSKLGKPLLGFYSGVLVFDVGLPIDFTSLFLHFIELQSRDNRVSKRRDKCSPGSHSYDFLGGMLLVLISGALSFYSFWQPEDARDLKWYLLSLLLSIPFLLFGFNQMFEYLLNRGELSDDGCKVITGGHSADTVPQQYPLTNTNYWGTVIVIGRTDMANVLPMEKRIAVISALAEGSGIRQIERMTGISRNTIMNLGVRVGQGCANLMDRKMRNLSCEHLQFDELWGFIGKKQKHVQPDDNPNCGDVWTFCAIDSDTKLVPSFKVGKRTLETANAFVGDVASRMAN
jgi:hypothetical protein